MTQLRQLFDDTFNMLNSVATATQQELAFKNASREFFSYVFPIIYITNVKYEEVTISVGEDIVMGFEDTGDILGLGIGDFTVVEVIYLENKVAFRIKPNSFSDFLLNDSYIGSYQYVVEYMLKKVERNNMKMLKSAGIDDGESIDVEDISQIRDYLKKEFGVTAVGLVT